MLRLGFFHKVKVFGKALGLEGSLTCNELACYYEAMNTSYLFSRGVRKTLGNINWVAVGVGGGYGLLTVAWMALVIGKFNSALASWPSSFDWPLDVSLFPMAFNAVTHLSFTFSTPLFNAPQGANLAWTAMNYAWALGFSPLAALWGVLAGYNAILFCSFVTNGMAMYWALRHWVKWRLAAFVGGAMFMFSPFVVGQALANHLQLVSLWTLPIIGVLVYRTLVTQDAVPWKTGTMLGGLLLVQTFTSEEVEAQIIMFGVGIGVIWMWQHRRHSQLIKHAIVTVGWSMPLTVLGLGIMTQAQLLGGNVIHGQVVGAAAYGANLLDLVVPGQWNAITLPVITQLVEKVTFSPGEATAYIGVPIMLMGIMLWRRKEAFDVVVLAVAVVATVLMLGPVLIVGGQTSGLNILPMALIGKLPMLANLLPDRISLVLDAAIAVIVARFIDTYLRPRITVLSGGLLALAIASWLPIMPSAVVPPLPHFFQHPIHAAHTPILLVLPFAQVSTTTISEYWQAVANDSFAITGGDYTARPVGKGLFGDGPKLTHLTLDFYSIATYGRLAYPLNQVGNFNAYLRQHHVAAIVVGPAPHEKMMVAMIEALTHTRPQDTQGVWLWNISLPGFRDNLRVKP